MHRQLHPRRRPPAAAPGTFSGRAVTPTPGPTPVAGMTPTSVIAAQVAPTGCIPPDGTHIKISARPAGGTALSWTGRPLSTGRPVQGRQMTTLRRYRAFFAATRLSVEPEVAR
jgi:hypothetical protein